MTIPGKRIKVEQWIHASACVVRVEVEAIVPDAGSSDPCLEPKTLRFLDEIQTKADQGLIDELSQIGDVYVRRSA
jgi:hypothetical protein